MARGHAEIRAFYADLLSRRSEFPAPEELPPLRNGGLAMTFARLPNGNEAHGRLSVRGQHDFLVGLGLAHRLTEVRFGPRHRNLHITPDRIDGVDRMTAHLRWTSQPLFTWRGSG